MSPSDSIRPSASRSPGAPVLSAAGHAVPPRPVKQDRAQVGAYYLNANMYTAVPSQVRADLEWMADKGTDFLCCGVLEQDLWSAHENLALIIEEAARVGIRVLAVPSRWGGLTAGAPKVPSMFSALNPHTWIVNEDGISGFTGRTSGVISSVHWPETRAFFCESLADLYRQHPRLAGMIIDEPKGFVCDHSPKAKETLGVDAPRQAHLEAAARFYDDVCAFAKRIRPDLLTLLFMEAHHPDDQMEVCARMRHLDYFGADGRPWDLETDQLWWGPGGVRENAKDKVLLSGVGERFLRAAKAGGKRSFFLIENLSLDADMIDPMDRHLPDVMASGADMYLYYYYPRNVQHPDRAMEVIGRHIQRYTNGGS